MPSPNETFESHLFIVHTILRKYYWYSEDLQDDIRQTGYLRLLELSHRFTGEPADFHSYAWGRVHEAMWEAARRLTCPVKVPHRKECDALYNSLSSLPFEEWYENVSSRRTQNAEDLSPE